MPIEILIVVGLLFGVFGFLAGLRGKRKGKLS
jgi:hypothetical protein